ncbi:LacI family DNA-binding transcriptional regulator [Salipaludibacillus sp. CUR1]|uniref:LacI family DNA-binding transcriptional regulator n=1 Tax=Salipaludibacillus sp. CUR1 TaxID=2820003 RepID=UPI001E36A379|nr:LacI family DNA-binding transcriptional regulator [Salipaludibacillus sp. CUR1]MCE7792699.1 LacI family DNA-binding transcriptional regulator [Salipaludibacillus sp. CUR1]
MATIRDIANKTGFSIATVSRVLNYDTSLSVSAATKERIFKAAEDLNYRTLKERAAKQESKTYKVGMVQLKSDIEEINDPYYLAIRLGIEKICRAENIELVKVIRQSEDLNLNSVDKVDGFIVVGKFLPEEIKKLREITDSLTFVDDSPLEATCDSVVIDFNKSLVNVLDYLISLNHREIGFIGGTQRTSPDHYVIDEREKAFKEYLTLKGLFNEEYMFTGQFTSEDGYQLMKEALKKPKLPTAFFVASDSMAIGALRALHEHNITVPDEVSIVGFNDIAASKFLQPSLSTVKVYTEFMGETAVELMVERLKTRRKIPKKVVIPTEFIKRESTGKVN